MPKIALYYSAELRAQEAKPCLSYVAVGEGNTLEMLDQKKYKSTAKLIYIICGLQQMDQWTPGGYIIYILMEKLPGTTLENFKKYDRQEQVRIRESFKESYL